MAEFGEYSSVDNILAIYEDGKLIDMFSDVIAETLFLNEDYHNKGEHLLDFKIQFEDSMCAKSYPIKNRNSFCVFPSWMEERLKGELYV